MVDLPRPLVALMTVMICIERRECYLRSIVCSGSRRSWLAGTMFVWAYARTMLLIRKFIGRCVSCPKRIKKLRTSGSSVMVWRETRLCGCAGRPLGRMRAFIELYACRTTCLFYIKLAQLPYG